ncbi:unnamed protein product [Prunus armeniaca]|uniref:Uncharacterized protein n=1 Tax=Prunus armeniaca TaxID=36596 RepID=A0A6J5Y7S6_PRUAR|nr:unnamed protein product [Prunus armeniaca]CAB4319558.1 unnamed protein product [Prunus armeniaca]
MARTATSACISRRTGRIDSSKACHFNSLGFMLSFCSPPNSRLLVPAKVFSTPYASLATANEPIQQLDNSMTSE